jgi:flagellar hook-associated protein 1 FlgK
VNGLSSALSSALSGLFVSSGKTSVLSTNISRAGEEGYSRKVIHLTTDITGNARIASISRNSDKALLDKLLSATSAMAGSDVRGEALNRLHALTGDVEIDGSLAWSMAELRQSILDYEATPSSLALASQAVRTGDLLAASLRSASTEVQALRSEADAAMAQSVDRINSILSKVETITAELSGMTAGTSRAADLLDQRDGLLKDLASEIGIKVSQRADHDIAIHTDSGVTLFDIKARAVSFESTAAFDATVQGNAVYADGVRIAGNATQMAVRSGKLQAYAEIRDRVAPAQAAQLDEIARGLIELFAERDQGVPPSSSDAAGLFTYPGAPALPAGYAPGLASRISLNAAFDAGVGGNPHLLRDGGANGPAYVQNTAGLAGFQARLAALSQGFDRPRSFSAATQFSAPQSLLQLASGSAGWVEQQRSEAASQSRLNRTIAARAESSLSGATGVNLDQEMALLLEAEKSYQASAKVMGVINGLFSSLFGAAA